MKISLRRFWCLSLILCLLLSGCGQTVDSAEHMERILKACSDPANTFPSDRLQAEFQVFEIPTAENNRFRHTVRFENISGQPLEVQILGFYDLRMDENIIARGGGLQPKASWAPLTLQPNEGWIFDNTLTPLQNWDTYPAEEQDKMIGMAKNLYFEIILENVTYCCILDCQAQEIITVIS